MNPQARMKAIDYFSQSENTAKAFQEEHAFCYTCSQDTYFDTECVTGSDADGNITSIAIDLICPKCGKIKTLRAEYDPKQRLDYKYYDGGMSIDCIRDSDPEVSIAGQGAELVAELTKLMNAQPTPKGKHR